MKKGSKMIACLAMGLTVFALSACGSSGTQQVSNGSGGSSEGQTAKKIKIGLTVGTLSNPFFVSMGKGAEEAAKKYNAEVYTVSADYDLAKQTSQIEDFITKKVDLILLNAVDSKGIAGAVQEAKAAHIPIIALDVAAEGGVDATVTSDNVQAGKIVGEYLVKRLNGKGNIAILDGPPVSAVTDRIQGFEEAIKGTGINVVAKQNGEGNKEKALSVMENILQAKQKGQLDAVFAINDPEGLGAKIAAEQAGRDKDLFIVGVDGSPQATDALKEKKSFAATAAQHPDEMVKTAVDLGVKIIKGEKVDPVVKVPVELVTQDNVNSYRGW
ncbi:ribose ABC superfamily ATP-binding protein [Collibacillus ludicampi]|jgi:ribose transport system substrate-binding protein|uniref:Ribose ABC superfamily ATP-binding protein n=1 Tax=Collibacillus ludicampi TaxID=2771369 RepID=A0AAV4LGE7_9BACL|nr:ABC transporter substrate-binding protein [Collibacillus ludicampi]GIM46714.1 ribose ABC superfamily ATP-binding protein [Collibacillus ludicampi]